MANHIVQILPHGREIKIEEGENLLAKLIEHSNFLRSDCGGKGICGKRLVKIHHADKKPETAEACCVRVFRDVSDAKGYLSFLWRCGGSWHHNYRSLSL